MSEQTTTEQATAYPPMLKVDDIALMMQLSRATVDRMRRQGTLLAPVIEQDRVLRWSRSEVLAWIDAGCPTADQWAKTRPRDRRVK